MKKFVKCKTLYGKVKSVSREKLIFRPAAYGIIIKDNKILLVNTRRTGKLYFPGGAVRLGEKIEDALRREIKEETGIEINNIKFFTFTESFFYYDPEKWASHNLSFYYICKSKNAKLLKDDEVKDLEAEKPRWIEMNKLKKSNFHDFPWEVCKIILKRK